MVDTSFVTNQILDAYRFEAGVENVDGTRYDFKGQMLRDDHFAKTVVHSKVFKLTDEEFEQLLPYCNALEFEPFRNKDMSMDDAGWCGYLDEDIRRKFIGITDSYIPKIELPMDYFYSEVHSWPSQRLYNLLMLMDLKGKIISKC